MNYDYEPIRMCWLIKQPITLLHFIDKRLRQMAIFTSLSKQEGKLLYSFSIKTNKILYDLSLYYIKQVYSLGLGLVAVHLLSDRSRKMSKWGTNISETLSYRLQRHFFVLTTFDVISDLLLNRCTATLILFVKLYVILLLLKTYDEMFSHSNLNLDYSAYCT